MKIFNKLEPLFNEVDGNPKEKVVVDYMNSYLFKDIVKVHYYYID